MTANHSSTPVEQQPSSFADGLRALADLIDEHPVLADDFYRHLIPVYSRDRLAQLVRELGGHWQKDEEPDIYFGMTRDLGGGVKVYVYAPRDAVCERTVVGTRTVQKPAPDAPMIEVEEEIVEWRCPDSLLRDIPVTGAEDEAWDARRLDRDDDQPASEVELMAGYGLAVHADEIARRRRVPHALKRDLGIDER